MASLHLELYKEWDTMVNISVSNVFFLHEMAPKISAIFTPPINTDITHYGRSMASILIHPQIKRDDTTSNLNAVSKELSYILTLELWILSSNQTNGLSPLIHHLGPSVN